MVHDPVNRWARRTLKTTAPRKKSPVSGLRMHRLGLPRRHLKKFHCREMIWNDVQPKLLSRAIGVLLRRVANDFFFSHTGISTFYQLCRFIYVLAFLIRGFFVVLMYVHPLDVLDNKFKYCILLLYIYIYIFFIFFLHALWPTWTTVNLLFNVLYNKFI